MEDLLAKACISSTVHNGIDDEDALMFSVTVKGARYLRIYQMQALSGGDENIQKQPAAK